MPVHYIIERFVGELSDRRKFFSDFSVHYIVAKFVGELSDRWNFILAVLNCL